MSNIKAIDHVLLYNSSPMFFVQLTTKGNTKCFITVIPGRFAYFPSDERANSQRSSWFMLRLSILTAYWTLNGMLAMSSILFTRN